MLHPWHRGPRQLAIAIACLAFIAGAMTTSNAKTAGSAPAEPLRVLQMNLCDSGIAGCYTGRAVAQAATLIRADQPDVVTLNEVCQEDVAALDRAMSAAGGGVVVSAFKSAGDRLTDGPYRCLNGQPYGIGLLVHIARYRGYATSSGLYPTQDLNDPEERVWVCVYAIGDFYACTTHLADTSRVIALAQCKYLLNTIVPRVRDRNGGLAPTVIGGDLNLGTTGAENVEACVPSGYVRLGDGGVQYVIATTDLSPASERTIAMHGTTDHPGLMVSLQTSAVPGNYQFGTA